MAGKSSPTRLQFSTRPRSIGTCCSPHWPHRSFQTQANSTNSFLLRAHSRLKYPLPEMIFGNNRVIVEHESGFALTFDSLDALESVDCTGNANEVVRVAYADEWASKRKGEDSEDIKDVIKP